MVGADEAREHIAAHHRQVEAGWGGMGIAFDLAHTVVVQAEQLAALTALVRAWGDTEVGQIDDQDLYERFEAIVGKPALDGDQGAVVEADPYGRSADL